MTTPTKVRGGKKYVEAVRRFDRQHQHSPGEAVDLVKSLAPARFDETIEMAVRLGVDPRKADQIVRGTVEPFSIPAAALRRTGVGGVLVMKVNERSSNTVISAGMTVPRWLSVVELYCRQNSMMFTP